MAGGRDSAVASAHPVTGQAAPGRYAWLVLGLLCVVYVLNFLDRQLLSAVAFVQNAVAPRQRTLAGAVLLLMNLIGLGLGPTWLGATSDWLKASHPGNALQLAFYTLVPFYFLAIALRFALARALKRDYPEASS